MFGSKPYQLIVFAIALMLILSCGNSKDVVDKDLQQQQNRLAFKQIFHEANSQKMIGHSENAISLFNKCLELDPNSAACYYALSQIYMTDKEYENAIEYGKQAYNLNPKNKWYAANLGGLFFQTGDYFNSASYYEKVINEFEDRNIDTKSRLVEAYIFSDRKEKAVDLLDEIEIELGKTVRNSVTKYDLLIELGENKLADNEIKSLFDAYENNIEIPVQVMDYFLQTRRLDMAKVAIDQIQKINEKNGNALIGLAEIELSKNNINQTFALLEEGFQSPDIAIERKLILLESLARLGFEPRYPQSKIVNEKMNPLFKQLFEEGVTQHRYLSLYGKYLYNNDHLDSARLLFRKAVQITPSDFDSWLSLLDANYILKQYDSLIGDANQAMELFPSQPLVYLLSGIGYYETNVFEKSEEMFFLGKGLVVNDQKLIVEFDYHLAKSLWKQGEIEEAKKAFDKVISEAPDNDKFLFGYATLLNKSGEYKMAKLHIAKAVDLAGRTSEYLNLYAELLMKEQDYKQAYEFASRAVANEITNANYIEQLGDISFFLKEIDKAVELWNEANAIAPTNILKNKIETRSMP